MKFITSNGHKIAVEAFNEDKEKTPIIFIHGIFGSLNFWIPGMNEFIKQEHPWYSLSLPGHYPSTFPKNFKKEDITLEMYFNVVDDAIKQLGIKEKVVLIGHSFGAFPALNYAAKAPENVKGVLSISGLPNVRWNDKENFIEKISNTGKIAELITEFLLRLVTKSKRLFVFNLTIPMAKKKEALSFPKFKETRDLVFEDIQHHNIKVLYDLLVHIPNFDVTDDLSKINVPILIIIGDKDPTTPVGQIENFAKRVPNARIEIIKGVGHYSLVEDFPKYDSLLRKWLADLEN